MRGGGRVIWSTKIISTLLPVVEVANRDPLLVEIGGDGGNVTDVGVVYQRRERHRTPVQVVQDLKSTYCIQKLSEMWSMISIIQMKVTRY